MDSNHLEALYPPDSRFEEVAKVIGFIKSGNCVQLVSLPGVGKSNILGLLAYNRKARELHLGSEQKDYHFVLMNFSEVRTKDEADVFKFIFLELLESLRDRKYDFGEIKKLFDEIKDSKDELVIFQGLKKAIDYLALQKNLSVVFLFDRFDEYIPQLSSQFFSNLRVLRDRAKYKFSVVFPINRPLEESIGHEILSDFYEFIEGNIVYLNLSDQKMLDFRVSYLEERNGQKIDKKTLGKILELTGGHGKLTRICIEEYFTNKKTIENLAQNQRVRGVLLEIWKALSPYEQGLIQKNKADESTHLVAVGLVRENKIAIPLLQEYVIGQKENEKIEYNEAKNEIKKGGTVISHGLTSFEFKLLKLLIKNQNQVLSRDEIVETVWAELASTSGVSEQALDQLIFRLRKKIEENPNSPTHIQTVKGRGIKFSP